MLSGVRLTKWNSFFLGGLIVQVLNYAIISLHSQYSPWADSIRENVMIYPQQSLSTKLKYQSDLAVLKQVPQNYADSLLFYVYGFKRFNDDCGGCMIMNFLYHVLRKSGFKATIEDACPGAEMIDLAKRENRAIVVIYPETAEVQCSTGPDGPTIVPVRWILAPLGTHSAKNISVVKYGAQDLLFFYGTDFGPPGGGVGPENVLQVVKNPQPGDATDLTKEEFYNRARSGVAVMMRKGEKFHSPSWMKHLRNQSFYKNYLAQHDVTEIPDNITSVTELQSYKYFVTYDPYTYWSWLAAMSGVVSVVHQVENKTKHEWAMGTFMGAYMQSVGLSDFPGIAYGWRKSEIIHAIQTMDQLRPFLIRLKKWGEEVTVPRMARDCYRYAFYGERSHFEGALVNENVYKRDMLPTLEQLNV